MKIEKISGHNIPLATQEKINEIIEAVNVLKGCPAKEKFKECYECAKKPGSPQLCPQCLWARENWEKVK